ncbi:DUF2637 domain-containing protein [Nonomuraea sp. NBC_01738]|uniref:DUF2637 domain-containing protein n=1 Tax=Nonomuraea sp. NBC_01738 TaxID=2976003 RepID=UPI002E156F0D|nr:DUF2637 domain-containing protein [Nonomuraea sp. NBC_01738]
MDVTPPSLLRRLGLALAGLAVAALTGAACALSFDDLRALAILGEARSDLAYLYPAGFDALLVVALISVLLLRTARALVRAQAAVVLVLLILAAAAVNVTTTLAVTFDVRQAALGVAVAPWVMLAVALWLWLLLINHVQARRSAVPDEVEAGQDLVPFHRVAVAPPLEEVAAHEHEPEPTPLVGPTAAAETPAISGAVTRWAAPPAPQPWPQATPDPEPEPEEPADQPVEQPVEEHAEEPAVPKPAEPEDDKPVKWGDRVRPSDVLVHPRTEQVTERDADTQPVRVFGERTEIDDPDPGHGPEAGDEHEAGDHAPAGRMRSTPLPPEE